MQSIPSLNQAASVHDHRLLCSNFLAKQTYQLFAVGEKKTPKAHEHVFKHEDNHKCNNHVCADAQRCVSDRGWNI